MKNINWNEVEEAKEFPKVEPGGYVCGITAVEDLPDKEYLRIEYDIAEGEHRNYYRELYMSKGFWGASFIKSYKETARPFFKAFKTAVENSNPGYVFNNDEKTLVRKYVGLVLAKEEYKANDGTVKERLYVDQIHSIDKIRKGEYTVPELKKLKEEPKAAAGFDLSDFEPLPEDNTSPFDF